MWTCKLVSYISWKICIFQRLVRLALIGRTFRKLQSQIDWWRPVHSVWAHSNAAGDVSHSSCEIFFPSKSWDIEAVGWCCPGPIIILFQLVDSVSRFLSEKLQNNKIVTAQILFFFHAFFCSPRPPFWQFRQLVRSFTDFYFIFGGRFIFAAVTSAASGVWALGRPHPFVTCPFDALAVCPLRKFARNSKDRLEQVEKAKREMMERAGQEWNGTEKKKKSNTVRARVSIVLGRSSSPAAVAEARMMIYARHPKQKRKYADGKSRKILSWASSWSNFFVFLLFIRAEREKRRICCTAAIHTQHSSSHSDTAVTKDPV